MFTGIIETIGKITGVQTNGTNIDFWIESNIAPQLKPDQSVAHDGVCLTVTAVNDNAYKVTAVAETLAKTNLGKWQSGHSVNLERAMKVGDRLDGHFVQGHADATALCTEKQILDGSWLFRFQFPPQFAPLVIEKGSVCVNGVSLTAFNVSPDSFTVTIIPFTYTHTNFSQIEKGTRVNIEFDVLGKYILRERELSNNVRS